MANEQDVNKILNDATPEQERILDKFKPVILAKGAEEKKTEFLKFLVFMKELRAEAGDPESVVRSGELGSLGDPNSVVRSGELGNLGDPNSVVRSGELGNLGDPNSVVRLNEGLNTLGEL